MQEPVLVAMFFFPMLGSSPKLRIAVDATAGIGVHTVLFVYVSLFHGFQYHTAAISKKRTAHQRQNLQLRRAAKYLARNQSPTERWVDDYYDQYGDIDGSASTIYLRLGNDPFADGWADFLLTKLFLLFLGVASVIGTAYCRFPPRHDNVAELDDEILDEYKFAYIISTALQFIILITWVFLILAAAMETGRKLRTEPFLGTRPVQLAYRILFAHMSLSFLALLVSFCLNLSRLLRKWSLADQTSADSLSPLMTTRDEDLSRLEMIMMVLSQVARQFPYSGTAASVGSGRILFATISILITAFIFLPAHALEDEDEDLSDRTNLGRKGALQDKLQEQRRLRRDKRSVVNLAKQSKTWRVFPIPIEQSSVATTMLQDNLFQLYKDGHVDDDNIRDRGIVSRGPYTPLFCLELSCWLNECSWQAYYSPAGIQSKRAATGGMNLEALGLRLEGAVLDDVTDTQAYIATNIAPQVDGDEDSIIVIAFRGTASASNLQTDLRSRQVRSVPFAQVPL